MWKFVRGTGRSILQSTVTIREKLVVAYFKALFNMRESGRGLLQSTV